jgi:hypothetical protein
MCWNNADATVEQQSECSRLFRDQFVLNGYTGYGVASESANNMQAEWSQLSYDEFSQLAQRDFTRDWAMSSYLLWQSVFVESQWSQNIRNNPEDAFLTVVYSAGAIALLAATGGGAAFIIGATAVVLGDLTIDFVEGDEISYSDIPMSRVIGAGFMSAVGNWFFGGGELASVGITKGELFLYGTGLATSQQTFELAVDYSMDGVVNLNSMGSYIANLLLSGSDNLLPANEWSEFLQFLAQYGRNLIVEQLNNANCPD